MSKQFCTNCGFELEPGAAFCPNCGTKQESVQAVQQAAVPEQQGPRPVEYQTVPLVNQPHLGGPAPKPDRNNGLGIILAIVIGFAALIVLLCVLIFGGKGGALKNYKYRDIVGSYSGDVVMTDFDIKGALKEYLGDSYDAFMENVDERIKSRLGETVDGEARLTLDRFNLYCDEFDDFFGEPIKDFEFSKGRAKGTCKVEDENNYVGTSSGEIKYDLTLKEDNRYDYRITGTIQYNARLKLASGSEVSYTAKVKIDLTFDAAK